MNKEIISALLPAAMLGKAEGVEESFRKMSVNIDRVLRSDFVGGSSHILDRTPMDKPYVITTSDTVLREDMAVEKQNSGEEILSCSPRYETPYVVVPRVVGNE